MKLHVTNTTRGLLVPTSDEDYESKKKLVVGETYVVDIRLARNYEFHKKYFALIDCAWSLLPERVRAKYKSSEGFRKYVQVAAGHYEVIFHPRLLEFVEIPKSISFEEMDQAEFEDLYGRVREVIDSIVLRYVSVKTFEQTLLNF